MKKRILLSTLIMAVVLNTFAFTVTTSSDFSDYIPISTPQDLLLMNNSSSRFYLTNDIDMTNYGNWQSFNFRGTLDGNGFEIQNLVSTHGGLFSRLTNGAIIRNLGLRNININRIDGRAGGIANEIHMRGGNVTVTAKIYNSYVIGDIRGSNAGGFVGFIGSDGYSDSSRTALTIENSYMRGNVIANGSNAAGGFVGRLDGGSVWHRTVTVTIINCHNDADVTSAGSSGGIIGINANAHGVMLQAGSPENAISIFNSINNGEIVGGNANIGGIIGNFNGRMESCYNYGIVRNANTQVGHFAGGLIGTAGQNAFLVDSATRGDRAIGTLQSGSLAQARTNVPLEDFKKQETYIGFDFENIWIINPSIYNGFPVLRIVMEHYIIPCETCYENLCICCKVCEKFPCKCPFSIQVTGLIGGTATITPGEVTTDGGDTVTISSLNNLTLKVEKKAPTNVEAENFFSALLIFLS
jgi:hypothetical protein